MQSSRSDFAPWLLLQDTLNAVFGSVKGEECIFLWRFIGGVLATLLPALAYGCRVSACIWPWACTACM